MKQEIKSFNPNFFADYPIYSCVQKKYKPTTIIKKKEEGNNDK